MNDGSIRGERGSRGDTTQTRTNKQLTREEQLEHTGKEKETAFES